MMNFIHIPKVAGSSFFKLLSAQTENRPIGYSDIVTYLGHNRAVYAPHPTFCFIRNPYDRLVSAYNYLIKDRESVYPDTFYRTVLLKYHDFKDFVFHIEEHNLNQFIWHIQPMSYYICDDDGKICVDYIFKIELPELIDTFLHDIGIEENLSSIFVNVYEHEPYKQWMDSETKKEIERVYALDFEIFYYEKES